MKENLDKRYQNLKNQVEKTDENIDDLIMEIKKDISDILAQVIINQNRDKRPGEKNLGLEEVLTLISILRVSMILNIVKNTNIDLDMNIPQKNK